MKTVFIGSTRFSIRCLETLADIPEVELTGIVTARETFSISYRPQGVRNVLYADVSGFASRNNIPLATLNDKMGDSGLVETIRGWKPEFILVAGWHHMIPKSIRDIAPCGGLHASLLPDYSGGAPLVWAMINGEEKTGITFFLLNDKVDAGPIIGQKEEPILKEDTIKELYARIEDRAVELLLEHMPLIASGKAEYRPQDESKRRIMPQRGPEDGEIDLSKTARELLNFIRAQAPPYPGAFIRTVDGKKLVIEKAKVSD